MNRILIIGLMCLLCTGCSVEGEASSEYKEINCTDTRDGETFTIDTDTITTVRVGLLGVDSCFDAIDNNRETRTMCKSHEAFMKCKGVE